MLCDDQDIPRQVKKLLPINNHNYVINETLKNIFKLDINTS